MRICRYILCVLAIALLLQVACIVGVIALASPQTVDTNDSRKTIFQTDSKMAVYGSPIVARGSDRPQIVILGISNTTMGLRPQALQPYLGDVPIHNLSIGSERFRAIAQVADLLYRQTPVDQQHHYIFVIGLSFHLIAQTPQKRDSPTSVEDEEQRFALFTKTPQGAVPRLPDSYLSNALQAAWPFLVPKMIYNRIIRTLPERYWFGLAEPVPFTPEESDTAQYTKAQNQERIDFYNSETIDTTGHDTFDIFTNMVERMTAMGAQVVIVDLPTARWLQRATPLYAAYRKLRAPYLARLVQMPHVRYINAEDGFTDDDFYDGLHPRHRISGAIARKIAPTIKQALEETR